MTKPFTFHVLGLPHTVTNADYTACAYTQKALKFCKMMTARGHNCIHYGHPDSSVEARHVDVISRDTFTKVYGEHDHKKHFFTYNVEDEAYKEFYSRAIEEISKRKSIGDFILPFWGHGTRKICDAHQDLICVEPGIGYASGFWAQYKVWESYAIMHAAFGIQAVGFTHPRLFDVVIPNYFDVKDFQYNDKKEDFFLYLGRVYDGKGVNVAIEVTRKIGAKLVIAGQRDPKDKQYANFPPHVEFIGYADTAKRRELMSKAKASFMPSMYIEPFGGVMVENFLSGTPILSTDWGSFAENNIHGVTGYRCRTMDQWCWAARNISSLSPYKCRTWGMNFSLEATAPRYEEYFQMVADNEAVHPERDGLWWLSRDYPE